MIVTWPSGTDPTSFKEQVLHLLFGRNDWPAVIRTLLGSIPDAELCALALENPEPLDIQPRTLCIAATDTATVVLNWFNREEFLRLAGRNRQAPHHHHFDFGTRILRGGYIQWLFMNDGTLGEPRLRFGKQRSCRAGGGYHLAHDVFHHVFTPEDKSLTLMVRSARRVTPKRDSRAFDREVLLRERDMVASMLEGLQPLPSIDPDDCTIN